MQTIPGLLSLLLVVTVSTQSRHEEHSKQEQHTSGPVANHPLVLGRWRREPKPVLTEHRENKFKPVLLDCNNLNPEVDEEAEPGAAVFQIKAEDKDFNLQDPDSSAGKIKYSIISTHKKFKIDKETGWLSTNTVFNRDEPDIEKQVHVTVKVSDNGKPPLEDVCTIAVKIKDINDNSPIFDRANYDVPVFQNTEAGRKIMLVSATDIDEGDNQKITYELRAERYPADIEYFRWDEKTGEVWLNKKLDKPVSSVFVLKAIARDGGIPPKSSEIDVTVEVKESSNKSPVFRQGPGAEIELSEGMVDYSNPIATYMADSQIPGDFLVYFELVNGRTEQTNKAATFRAVPDPENQNQVNIYLAKPLEYEKVNSYTLTLQEYYTLTVIAQDGAPSSLLKNGRPNQTPNEFRIVIKDKNDNPPYFPQQDYTAEVPEDADIGSKVIEVKAKDLDGEASVTTYSIKYGNLGRTFKIEPQTGLIRVNKHLDYENIKEYTIIVTAEDGKYSNDTTVHIKIQNRNDMKPQFLQDVYNLELKEGEIPTYPIFQVTAYNPDVWDRNAAQNITYFLDKTNKISSHFAIDPDTGALRVIKPLDRDRPNGYPVWLMYVYVKDSFIDETGDRSMSLENFVEVKITLEDINDNAPFLNMPDGLVWDENAAPGRVGELIAEDYDTVENGPPFIFSLDKDADAELKANFAVKRDYNGKSYLETLNIFDRETKKGYKIPIRVEDNKGMSATSILNLVIGGKNDNPNNYEGKTPDAEIGRVHAIDSDRLRNSPGEQEGTLAKLQSMKDSLVEILSTGDLKDEEKTLLKEIKELIEIE